jgi:hypothetical protein
LKQFEEPIDIIIAIFSPVYIKDIPLNKNLQNDIFLQSMQGFYSELSHIVKEVVLLVENVPFFNQSPIFKIAANIKNDIKSFDKIGEPLKVNY